MGLLERWYDQSEGSVTLDGVDIRHLNVRWLRTRIRLVQQKPVLFSGTVFDNVANGLIGTEYESASREKQLQLVQNACKDAFAHNFIEELPKQYATRIGERGARFSGGQKQRIAIARSIISDPPVLLLDEATSALDPAAEKIVQKALENVSKSRTTLTIAHKLSTIQKADNIAVMAKGSVIEQGTHAELLSRDGAYTRLVSVQDLGQATKMQDPAKMTVNEYAEKPRSALARFRTTSSGPINEKTPDEPGEDDVDEGMGYSLIRCLYLLIKEKPRLWTLYSLLGFCSLCAGESHPTTGEMGQATNTSPP